MPPKKKTAAELIAEKRRVFVAPVWTSSRPKPRFDPDAWPDETAEMLSNYADWHGRHPHMVTPRKPDANQDKIAHKFKHDADIPGLVYYPNGLGDKPVPGEFTATILGADGNFEDASIVATVYERQATLAGGRESDDPWYTMSVRDLAEQYHIDGDSTTVRTKPKPKAQLTQAQVAFQKEEAWQKAEYGAYGGGGPAFSGAKRDILEALTLATPTATEGKPKVGPWETGYVFTRYTRDGTNLVDFNKEELERRVNRALETFRLMSAKAVEEPKSKAKKEAQVFGRLFTGDAAIAPEEAAEGRVDNGAAEEPSAEGGDDAGQDGEERDDASSLTGLPGLDDAILSARSDAGSSGSSRSSARGKKHKKKAAEKVDFVDELQLQLATVTEEEEPGGGEREEEKVDPDAHLGKYEKMMKEMGGQDACEQRAAEWIKLAAHVRRKAKRDTNLFDLSTDLCDSANKGDLVKVLFCLGVQGVDPDTRTPDDEALVIHMVVRILAIDNMTGSLHDEKDETPDRVRLHRVLQALLRFGADLAHAEAKGGQSALHLATLDNNSKMVRFLLEHGCSAEQFDRTLEPITPMMMAAKFGYVKVIAVLLVVGSAQIDQADLRGRTALHHAGMFGQTRTALFLLQCGADKRLKDREGKSPGVFAEECGYIITGQTILTFTLPEFQTMTMLKFYADAIQKADEAAAKPPSTLLGSIASGDFKAASAGKALANLGESFTQFVGQVITGSMGLARRALGIRKPDKPELTT